MSLVAATGDIILKSVLIATDFSEASEKALRHGLAIARHYGAKLSLFHVLSPKAFSLVGPEAVHAAAEAVCRDARRLKDDLMQTGALTGISHEVIVRQGEVWEEMEQVVEQERVEMIVLGTHGRHGLGRLLLGSVAETIFRQAECLVLTVGPYSLRDSPVGSSRAIQPFLFATDFSPSSVHALPYAISAANHFGARLVLLHVIAAQPILPGGRKGSAEEVHELREKSRLASLQKLEELVSNQPRSKLNPEFSVEFGSPAEGILQVAENLQTDAIILGLKRATHVGTSSHMPWAGAYRIASAACCAVLTVRN